VAKRAAVARTGVVESSVGGYRFLEHTDGFTIEHRRCDAVTIYLQPWTFVVYSREREVPRFGLCQGSQLISYVAAQFVIDRLFPCEGDESTPYRQMVNRSIVRATANELRSEIHRQRRRLLAKVDPTVLAVQRAVLTNGGEYSPVIRLGNSEEKSRGSQRPSPAPRPATRGGLTVAR
jgi:hypothetical protein